MRVPVELRSPLPESDFDEVLALVQACDRAVYGDSDWTARELREEWDGLDLARDAWVAVHNGRLAGAMHLYDRRGGRFLADGYVHPELVGLGAGTQLLAAVEARACERADEVPAGEAMFVETAHLVGDLRAPQLLTLRGYERARTFLRMVIRLEAVPPEPAWPDGLELRPLDPDRDGRQVQAAVDEAFRHEWGYHERSYGEWAQRVLRIDGFDPGLCPVVWDGDEIAAVSLNYAKRMGDWGWVGTLAVRPAWRRRGLGLALLRDSFRRFHAQGERVVGLGVDVENPTGAGRLYERAGMHVLWKADVWRKDLGRVG
jgi:ribosomal protein S18 acetylase RimI-like enzyme